jgi:hypothetical protein
MKLFRMKFRFACPDMTSEHASWGKALAERYCHQSTVLHFHVNNQGELFYGTQLLT